MPSARDTTPDKLIKQYDIWHQNRLDYPGWIVCPKKNRDELWRYTERWIYPIIDALKDVSPPHDILLAYELIWRLEKTFAPIFIESIKKITLVLDKYNPYPNLIKSNDNQFQPETADCQDWEWSLIEEAWIGISFAFLSDARRDYDIKGFNKWNESIKKIVASNSEWQSKWYYEQCLYNLSCLKINEVVDYLEDWQQNAQSDYWNIKRGAVIAELGDLDLAEQIIEKSLNKIRSSHQPYSTNYSLLSQEGWAMYLLKTVKRQKSFPFSEEVDGLYRDRWEQLESYRCNPWTELNNTVANLYKPFPKPQGSKTQRKGFLPGTSSNTYHWGSGDYLNEVLPVFELPGLLNEIGIPLRIGNTVMYPEQIANAANWLAPFTPLRSLFLVIKVGNDKKIDAVFNYECIATLTKEDVSLIFNFLFNGFNFAVQSLSDYINRQGIDIEQWSERQIIILPEILSRIAFRLNTPDLERLLKLTIEIYQSPLFKENYWKIKHIDTLFKNAFYGASDKLILNLMPDLLKLPIPEANGFNICRDGKLNEPFFYLKWSENTYLDNNYDRMSWSESILNLIEVVRNGTSESRGRAAIRLDKLQVINGLTKEEENLFGEALWHRIDEETQLPKDTIFYNHAYLKLPNPEYLAETDIDIRVRQFLLKGDIPALTFGGAYHPSEKQYLKEVLEASLSISKTNIEQEYKLIEWTPEEAEQLLQKIEEWWISQSTAVKSFIENETKIINDDWQSYSFLLLKIFVEIIFPNIAKSTNEIKKTSLDIINELQELGFCINHTLPGLLFVDSERYVSVYQQLQSGLFASDKEEIELSIIGVYYWLLYANSNLLSAPPPGLLDTWINLIAMRRMPGLELAMNFISGLITKIPNFLTDNQKQILLMALEHLKKETELPIWNEKEMIVEDNSMIPVENRSYTRIQTSDLAHKLYKIYDQENVPSILIEWQKDSEESIHPQIRRIWT